ncbi:protein TolR [Gammaproteobacteria bacterium LSUCC0057]|uniref:Tol-Pal system protein TolR n=1 Tax=Gammaproteobacteria bacterium LSUCC0057 TaxID=2559237 RepID=A0A4Y8UKX8_9GAMM|nr:protein TolR [Gammaproteobacteria bacterium LSUCC0057]
MRKRLVAEINVVPYIDVMLVLLVVFMVTAPLLVQGVLVDLPNSDAAPVAAEQEPLIVSIKADGSYWLERSGEQRQQSLAEVVDMVAKVLTQQPATPVLVWGDEAVSYGTVVALMSALQGAGAASVGLVTEPPR